MKVITMAVLLTGLVAAISPARAIQSYGAQVVGERLATAGPVTWTYTLRNTSATSNYAIWLLAIEADESADSISVAAPEGWAADASMPHMVTWICFKGELGAGGQVSGFEITFSSQPITQSWSAMFNNNETGETPVDFGNVIVAEPSGIFTMALLCAAFIRRGRRHV